MSPNVYIIAGPDGIGKTTFAREFLPHFADCRNFVNADLIAQGVSPFSPEAAAFRAGRLMLNEVATLADQRADFGFETTLSGRTHLNLVRGLKQSGYKIHLFFLWAPSVEVALSRVSERVKKAAMMFPHLWSVGALIARSGTSCSGMVPSLIAGFCSTTPEPPRP